MLLRQFAVRQFETNVTDGRYLPPELTNLVNVESEAMKSHGIPGA